MAQMRLDDAGFSPKTQAEVITTLETLIERLLTAQKEALRAKLEGMKYQQPLLGTPETTEQVMLAVNKTLDEVAALLQ